MYTQVLYSSRSLTLIAALCLFHAICVVDGILTVFPVDTVVEVGTDVRLNCTTSINKPVNWQYGKDPNRMADVYISGEGLVRPYSKWNRHSMDEDPATGRYDLMIKSVSKEDEGVYICSEKSSRDDPLKARLTVTGTDAQEQSCQHYEIFLTDVEAKLNFSSCTHGPFYIDHVPVGKTHADDLYNNGQLLNDYARSGRFRVKDVGGSCVLYITSLKTSDAGTYTCRESSGLGQMHDKDLIVYEETCGNTNDVLSRQERNEALQCNRTIEFVGHRDTLITWIELNCNGSLCSVGRIHPNSCTLQYPPSVNRLLLQCDFFHENDQDGTTATLSESHGFSGWAVGLSIGVIIIVATICSVVYFLVRHTRKRDEEPTTIIPLSNGNMKREDDLAI